MNLKVLKFLFFFLAIEGVANFTFGQTYRLDSTFANNGIGRRNWGNDYSVDAQKILRQSDGSYLICGYEYTISQNAFYNNIWKVNACGQTDSSFGINGLVRHTFEQRNSGYDFALQPDGKIVVTGSQAPGNAGSQQKPFISRYLANGQPDSTFGMFGSNKITDTQADAFFSLIPCPNGKYMTTSGQFFMRFNPDGSRDLGFGVNGKYERPTPPGVNFSYGGYGYLRNDSTIWTVTSTFNGVN
jgi:uncharacterized delta-60 repeat protein